MVVEEGDIVAMALQQLTFPQQLQKVAFIFRGSNLHMYALLPRMSYDATNNCHGAKAVMSECNQLKNKWSYIRQ